MITYNQQPDMPTKSSTSLMPCPFCGEIVTLEYYDAVPKACKDGECIECGCCDYCDEFWAITHVCEPRISFDVITDTSDEAIESWNNAIQEESDTIDAWNTRAERTCRVISTICIDNDDWHSPYYPPYWEYEMECGGEFTWDEKEPPNYCPSCGAKVVG